MHGGRRRRRGVYGDVESVDPPLFTTFWSGRLRFSTICQRFREKKRRKEAGVSQSVGVSSQTTYHTTGGQTL